MHLDRLDWTGCEPCSPQPERVAGDGVPVQVAGSELLFPFNHPHDPLLRQVAAWIAYPPSPAALKRELSTWAGPSAGAVHAPPFCSPSTTPPRSAAPPSGSLDRLSTSTGARATLFSAGPLYRESGLAIAPVPVPAAVWLFGTALVGLIGFSRRRKAR